jgi:hypothetical protein
VSWDYQPLVFSWNNPTWAPDSRAKAYLHMDSNSRSYLTKAVHQQSPWQRWSRLSGVNDTAGPASVDSTMQTWFKITSHRRCQCHCWCRLNVSLTPLVPPQRCHWHRQCCLSGVIDTAGAIWHRWSRGPRIWDALAAFKGNINKTNYIGKLYYPIAITITQKYRGYLRICWGYSGVIDSAGAKIGDFIVEYLREFKAICKKALTR